jgi:hypothetical protein
MRTPGAEVARGRWCRSAVGRSLMEPLAVGGVAVFARCTASEVAGAATGLERPIFKRLCRSRQVHRRPGASPDGTPKLSDVHGQPYVSTTVVSTALARSDAASSSNLDNSTVTCHQTTGVWLPTDTGSQPTEQDWPAHPASLPVPLSRTVAPVCQPPAHRISNLAKSLIGHVCAFTGGRRLRDADASIDQNTDVEFPYDKGTLCPEVERSLNLAVDLFCR